MSEQFDNQLNENSEKMLQDAIKARNQIQESEFLEFRPLYMKDGEQQVGGRANYSELATKFAQRVSLFHSIEIIKNKLTEDEPSEVIQTIPANFSRLDPMNNISNMVKDTKIIPAQDITAAFVNITGRDNSLTTDSEHITAVAQQYLKRAQNPERIKKESEEFAEIADRLKGKEKITTDDYNWR